MQRKAFVFNRYLRTLGGGERSSLDFAVALDDLGYQITFVSDEPFNISIEDFAAAFGTTVRSEWTLREFRSPAEMYKVIQSEKVDVFVNHTQCSFLPNPAPLGFYVMMFPEYLTLTLEERESLNTYTRIICNSKFTDSHMHLRWGGNLRSSIIPPPISSLHTNKDVVKFEEKEKIILNVGRFNILGHNKCQLDAIRSFKELIQQEILDDSWSLKIVGRIHDHPETIRYLGECKAEAEGYPIEILTDADTSALTKLYRKASLLWQFTGVGLEFGEDPYHCEHLGLVALDCFAYGAIPIVYHRTGFTSVSKHGIDGFAFENFPELAEIMQVVTNEFGSNYHRWLFENSLSRLPEFTFDAFRNKVQDVMLQG